MQASPRQQRLLLDLQDADHLIARLRRRRAQISERAELAALQAEHGSARDEFMTVQRELDSVTADIRRFESDRETVRHRRDRDRTLLETSTSAKEAQALQSELDTLERRERALEDRELELMQEAEDIQVRFDAARRALETVDERRSALSRAAVQAEQQLDDEIRNAVESRENLAAELQRDVLALYEEVRARVGIGAARLRGTISEGSNMALAPAELQSIRAAPQDEIIFCPGSGAILVRSDDDERERTE